MIKKNSTHISLENSPNSQMDKCKIFEWEVVLGVPDGVIIPCLMHGTRLSQMIVIMTNNFHGTKGMQIQN